MTTILYHFNVFHSHFSVHTFNQIRSIYSFIFYIFHLHTKRNFSHFTKYYAFPHILGTYVILRDAASDKDLVRDPQLHVTTTSLQ